MKEYFVLNIKKNVFSRLNDVLLNLRYRRMKRINIHEAEKNIYKDKFVYYLENNYKTYITIIIIYIIGLIFGCVYINNISYEYKTDIYNYTMNNINNLKEYKNDNSNLVKLNRKVLLMKSIGRNLLIGFCIMIFGPTIIGNIFIYIILFVNGFCLGFSISTITMCLGIGKSMLYIGSGMLLQNIIFIPILFLLSKISLDMYNYLIKDKIKIKDNIKNKIYTYIIKNLLGNAGMIFSAIIENFISLNLLLSFINVF